METLPEKAKKDGMPPDGGTNGYAQQLEANRQRIQLMDLDLAQKNQKLQELSREIEELNRLYPGK